MPLSILPKTQLLRSSFLKKMATIVASISPTHISPLTHLHSSPETNPPLSLFENCNSMDQLKQTHSQIIHKGIASEPVLHSKIIAFCCTNKAGCMNYARYVFDTIPEPNVYIWNTMIKGFTRINCPNYAVSCYKEMLERNIKPDTYTFPFLLKGYASDAALQRGKLVHAHVCKFGFDSNLFVQRALVCMYSLCGQIDIARGVFDMSSKNDVVSWNAMISGYNRSKRFDESRKFFDAMGRKGVLPTSVTLVSVLSACIY